MATMTVERRPGNVTTPERIQAGRAFSPSVDILESQEELLLMADVPGAQPENVDINFEQGELTISARVTRRQPENTRFLACEYGIGDFFRVFRIGKGIESNRIRAEISNGVLKVHLPKAENTKPRKIEVKAG